MDTLESPEEVIHVDMFGCFGFLLIIGAIIAAIVTIGTSIYTALSEAVSFADTRDIVFVGLGVFVVLVIIMAIAARLRS